jgi:RimJ/RimL family protein N-acetyltransferase
MLTDSQAGLIKDFKTNSFDSARRKALVIHDENLAVVGHLIPVGLWIATQPHLITNISEWRARDMKNYLIQFDSTFEKTKDYLMQKSLKETDRLLFLIVDASENFIGHLGLSKVSEISAELDNLMRGNPGGPKNFMELAEKTVIEFAFEELLVKCISLRVLSFNFLAISIHQRLGFVLSEREFLKKRIENGEVRHETATREESDVNFTCLIMNKSR